MLNHLSLTVFPEETVAIVGETGVGKTTLLNLLLRYYAPDEGQIRIDGTNIQDIPRRKLYRAMAVILQDGSMVTDTIRANISYGNPSASLSEIQDAAAQVHADPFIQRLPEGYQTQVSEERQILSSGERQLICLARIPLMNPRVLILDEATSSVDAHTEQIVQKPLRKIRKGRTCIIIAHRLNTIRDVDRIVVLDHGEIVEDGSHETLMKNKGKYYQLYMSGLSE